ncbi:MAG TPA: hypothetical protein VLJ62_03025 [Burkholderiaceae bacterium]|nr:hypothetical protein [Burkholderiaceae bacterium]
MLRGILLLWAAVAAAGSAVAADVAGTITILEGEALITRAAGRWRAAEGVRLQLGDIVETGDAAFVQVELVENTVLGIGPQARIMVGGPVRLKAERTLYALGGWYKLTNARKDGNARAFEYRSPLLEIGLLPGVVVMQLKAGEATVFAERGDLKLLERPAGAALGLRQGQTYRRAPGTTRGAVSGSPPASFLAELPRSFRDSLPLRADKYKDREIAAKPAPDFVYADVEPWLKSELPFRRQFIERWRAKARDAEFRKALVANLSSHPEWDPVLFPEKYLPKDPAKAASAASAAAPTTAAR